MQSYKNTYLYINNKPAGLKWDNMDDLLTNVSEEGNSETFPVECVTC